MTPLEAFLGSALASMLLNCLSEADKRTLARTSKKMRTYLEMIHGMLFTPLYLRVVQKGRIGTDNEHAGTPWPVGPLTMLPKPVILCSTEHGRIRFDSPNSHASSFWIEMQSPLAPCTTTTVSGRCGFKNGICVLVCNARHTTDGTMIRVDCVAHPEFWLEYTLPREPRQKKMRRRE